MRVNKILLFTVLFFCCFVYIKAQSESLKPLSGNSILINHKQNDTHNAQKQSSTAVYLPFFDDFSYNGPFPNANKWDMSQSVFVNRGYAIAPPTIGAATFDGLSRFGYPYNPAATSGSVLSDTLISVPIRLDFTDASQTLAITPADSIYLSFYYQMKGRGDKPEQNDVLNLLFFTATDTLDFNTTPVWSKSGSNVSPPANDSNFHRVMIPIYRSIDDTIFFKNGFRFAFSNWGTQSGAIDHWHIDQVYLNRGRTMVDTLFPDVSFVYEGKSLLKNYSQMPFNQFAGPSDMDSIVKGVIRNNNNKKSGSTWNGAVTLSTEYKILDNAGAQVAISPSFGTNVVYNYDSIGYCKDKPLINPSLAGYTYNSGPFAGATSFLQKFYLRGNTNDTVHYNDTAYFTQNFQNYYSYDDGTAEAGYYVGAFGGSIAVKYKLNVADNLRAFDIFFDPIYGTNLIQNENIHLAVWSDLNNKPSTVIFIDSFPSYGHPAYSNSGYDVFTRYQLSKPVPLAAGTTFYIGTIQTTTVQLGIGYDLNTDSHQNVFFYDGSLWQTSFYKGSLMMHPVFGDSLSTIAVQSFAAEKQNARVYPNPATNEIYISSSDKITKIFISDILGNVLIEEKNNSEKISVSSLPNGLYILRMLNNKGESSTQKLIISR